jgi:hypothetical protein
MSHKHRNDRRGRGVKELFSMHTNGVQNEIEDAVRDEVSKLREEFATKQDLQEAVATLQQADDDMIAEHERFVNMTSERFDRLGL